jgi:hypothetical protein
MPRFRLRIRTGVLLIAIVALLLAYAKWRASRTLDYWGGPLIVILDGLAVVLVVMLVTFGLMLRGLFQK